MMSCSERSTHKTCTHDNTRSSTYTHAHVIQHIQTCKHTSMQVFILTYNTPAHIFTYMHTCVDTSINYPGTPQARWLHWSPRWPVQPPKYFPNRPPISDAIGWGLSAAAAKHLRVAQHDKLESSGSSKQKQQQWHGRWVEIFGGCARGRPDARRSQAQAGRAACRSPSRSREAACVVCARR